MQAANVYIIVPAYNEEKVLRSTVLSLLETEHRVVVVDDGSATDLYNCINDLPVHYLKHPINLGQGAALQTGNSYALKQGADYLLHFDADGQHQIASVEALLSPILRNECDVTLGSRFLAGNTTIPTTRKFVLHSARYLHYFFTGILLTDAHNGLRAMNRMAAEKIQLHENRMAHASEFLFLLKKNRLRFKEVPVTIDYTAYSKQKGQSSFNSIRIFFDLLLHKLFE